MTSNMTQDGVLHVLLLLAEAYRDRPLHFKGVGKTSQFMFSSVFQRMKSCLLSSEQMPKGDSFSLLQNPSRHK